MRKVALVAIAFILCGAAFAQSFPDAPKQSSTCVYHGKPCSKFVSRIVGQFPPQDDQDIKPGSECWLEIKDGVTFQHCKPIRVQRWGTAHFWTVRRWNEPRLRPGAVEWITFVSTHAAGWALLATANHQKESWHSEGGAMAAVTGLDFVGFMFINPALGNIGSVRAIIHYAGAQ